MSENEDSQVLLENLFDEIDADENEILQDGELRVLATRLLPPPLTDQDYQAFLLSIANCSRSQSNESVSSFDPTVISDSVTIVNDVIEDADWLQPRLSRDLYHSCSFWRESLLNYAKELKRTKWPFQIVPDSDAYVAFNMLESNLTHVQTKMDVIRRQPRKFICLNDNLDHSSKEAVAVKLAVNEFLKTLFPNPSSFELPIGVRNRFLSLAETRQWEAELSAENYHKEILREIVIIFLSVLVLLAVGCFIRNWSRRKMRRRNRNGDDIGCC